MVQAWKITRQMNSESSSVFEQELVHTSRGYHVYVFTISWVVTERSASVVTNRNYNIKILKRSQTMRIWTFGAEILQNRRIGLVVVPSSNVCLNTSLSHSNISVPPVYLIPSAHGQSSPIWIVNLIVDIYLRSHISRSLSARYPDILGISYSSRIVFIAAPPATRKLSRSSTSHNSDLTTFFITRCLLRTTLPLSEFGKC